MHEHHHELDNIHSPLYIICKQPLDHRMQTANSHGEARNNISGGEIMNAPYLTVNAIAICIVCVAAAAAAGAST